MIEISVSGDKVVAQLRGVGQQAQDRLLKAMQRLMIDLQRKVKEEKLSGQVLQNRTGTLRRSINQTVTADGSSITGQVGTNVVYAAIHEFGGKTAPHLIEAKNAAALAFIAPWGPGKGPGGLSFFKSVHHPGSQMPERSFLRSALQDMQGQIEETLAKAVIDGNA